MTQSGAQTVRKQVVVDAPIDHAFAVFTERFGDFKPPEHNLLGAPIAETVFEPRVGGGVDFTGHGIGKILVPLMARREARKEMPANMATLKQKMETS